MNIYPGCKWATPPYLAPTLVIVGELDEWAPAKYCELLLKMPNKTPLQVEIYPGVHHNFDYVGLDDVKLGKIIRSDAAATSRAEADVETFLAKHVTQ